MLQTFNELQKLLIKNNGKVVGDLMTPNPLVVYETTNLEDAVRYQSSRTSLFKPIIWEVLFCTFLNVWKTVFGKLLCIFSLSNIIKSLSKWSSLNFWMFLILQSYSMEISHQNWKTYLMSKSNARLLLETKYRRLPVVDNDGKLVRIVNNVLDSFSFYCFLSAVCNL
jgi:CBS domain-containing protein